MTRYDDYYVKRMGQFHPLHRVPQEAIDAGVAELRESWLGDGESYPEIRSLGEAIVSSALQAIDFQEVIKDAYDDGVRSMMDAAKALNLDLPDPEPPLF